MRIPGDEASILATIEVVKVLLVAVTVSVLATLDNVWCMYVLRKHGEVVMYRNDIGHFASQAFRTLWHSFISFGGKVHTMERDKLAALQVHDNLRTSAKGKVRRFSFYRSVRTILLLSGVLLSLAEIVILFALSTEGKEVADKPEFDVRSQRAVEVPRGSKIDFYNAHETQLRYEYIIRRLKQRMAFRNGSEFAVQIPRRLDVARDEKWPYKVRLHERAVYATLHTRDFISEEKAQFSETAGQVTGMTEKGKRLVHYKIGKRDKIRNACTGGVGAAIVDGNDRSGILCYTDELRDEISCKDRKEGDVVAFKMQCSEIRVERFGEHSFAEGPLTDNIWWLTQYANGVSREGRVGFMQMVSLRGYKRDDVSPSSMIIASILTEFVSQSVLVERDFAIDVGVVVIPDWLVITTGVLLGVVLLLGALAAAYAASRNLVDLTNWQEMYIANLLEPLDCLNRSKRKEFRCVVSEGWDVGQRYQLFVEPRESNISPTCGVNRKEIGAFGLVQDVEDLERRGRNGEPG